jgi:hypothetical protein
VIRIGLNAREKQAVIDNYLSNHNIRKVFVLYWERFKTEYRVPCEIEYVQYKDIIMYKFFYRLLEEIDNDCLIVVDELLRTQNRSELTYNCAHHYLNQTEHRIVFEYFPFIETKADFMILLDFINKGKYRGKGFDWEYLQEEDVLIKDNPISFHVEHIPITNKQREKYAQKKESLFDNLGMKDPDTIPRNLHVFVGNWKKAHIQPDLYYIARNSRFRLDRVATYQKPKLPPRDDTTIYVLDFPHRRLDFNDYLKYTKATDVVFISTGLPVDNYYAGEFEKWLERRREFVVKAGVYR